MHQKFFGGGDKHKRSEFLHELAFDISYGLSASSRAPFTSCVGAFEQMQNCALWKKERWLSSLKTSVQTLQLPFLPIPSPFDMMRL
ncbi:unnamed protein product [Cylicostephanus goldi]|uniref:Uncharacterized protein n=1 Tax=Cylicostephanus goldi TaxID=71465 RepID=A0A3P6PYB1_CYLGO|nr:unnamed protein product [Cylicostephanus goldi]